MIWISEEYCAEADDENWPIIVAHELGHVVNWKPGTLPTNKIAAERIADEHMMKLAARFGFEEAATRIHEKHEKNIAEILEPSAIRNRTSVICGNLRFDLAGRFRFRRRKQSSGKGVLSFLLLTVF